MQRYQVELLVDRAETVEHHGFEPWPRSQSAFPRFTASLDNDLGDAEFFKHACDETQVI